MREVAGPASPEETAACPGMSAEIGAVGAMAEAAAIPVLALLLAEAEALCAMMPGMVAACQAGTGPEAGRSAAVDGDPFENMPV